MHAYRWGALSWMVAIVAACGGHLTGESPPSGSGGTFGTGGSGGAGSSVPTAGRCSFGSRPMPGVTPIAAPTVVEARIERFILGEANRPPLPTPAQITPSWAGDSATHLLDLFGGTSSASPGGFIRWLAKWSYDGTTPKSAPRWANVMAASSATLSSLIAAPNQDDGPHGVGYLTDRELLVGRPSIDRRGMMVLEHLVCQHLVPSPQGLTSKPVLTPGLTERDAHSRDINPAECAACHRLMDPFGHAFGHFDRSGVYQNVENGQPIDSSDVYAIQGLPTFQFSSIEDLAPQLAESCEVALCVSRSLLLEAIAPDLPQGADPPFSDDDVAPVADAFANSGFSIRTLVRSIVQSPAFLR